tara:strand:+ start:140 stop:409 length:270 start_codon:yes stop_codon:yes gene_type:complete
MEQKAESTSARPNPNVAFPFGGRFDIEDENIAMQNETRSVERWRASETTERELEINPKISSTTKNAKQITAASLSLSMCPVGGISILAV